MDCKSAGLHAEFVKSGRKDDCPYIDGNGLLFLFKINGLGFTEFFAGTALAFFEIDAVFSVYGIDKGNRLGVSDVDCFFCGQTFVKIIGDLDRAFLGAHATAHTFGFIHISWLLEDRNLEISRRALYRIYV